jgi:hypothetical protein
MILIVHLLSVSRQFDMALYAGSDENRQHLDPGHASASRFDILAELP